MAKRIGKAWGNALGGYRKQKRTSSGQWAGGASSGLGGKKGKALKATAKKSKTAHRSKDPGLHKNPATSAKHKYNRSQAAFTSGALSRQAGVIPYTRHGFSSHTAGVNGGMRVLPNYRVSMGGYIKVQNIDKTRREKQLRDKDNDIVLGLAQKVSPHQKLDPFFGAAIKKIRRNQVDKIVGGEVKVGKKSFARLTTDQNAMPTLTIEHNRSKSRTKRRTNNKVARRKGQWAYNDMVTKNRAVGTQVKPGRPARRK